jgi:hypothetical protein
MYEKILENKTFGIKLENNDIRFISNIDHFLSDYSLFKIFKMSKLEPEYYILFYSNSSDIDGEEDNNLIANFGHFFDPVNDLNINKKSPENFKIKYKRPKHENKAKPDDNQISNVIEVYVCNDDDTPLIKSNRNKSEDSLHNKQTSTSERIFEVPVDIVKESFSVSEPIAKENYNDENTNDTPYIHNLLFSLYILSLVYSSVLFFHLIETEYTTRVILNNIRLFLMSMRFYYVYS